MKKIIIILSLIFSFSSNIFAENEELIEGGIVKYDHHTHIVGIYKTPQEAKIFLIIVLNTFYQHIKKLKMFYFIAKIQKTEVNIFVKKNKEDIYCFVMMEGNKIIYASEIPEDDCPIIKKFLK